MTAYLLLGVKLRPASNPTFGSLIIATLSNAGRYPNWSTSIGGVWADAVFVPCEQPIKAKTARKYRKRFMPAWDKIDLAFVNPSYDNDLTVKFDEF